MTTLVCKGILLLGAVILSGVVFAKDREDELETRQMEVEGSKMVPLNCREVFVVRWRDGDPALRGIMYSAVGWDIDAVADLTRKVTITAQAGELSANGAFTPDGSTPLTVLAETTGRNVCDWEVTDPAKKIYRLTHVVTKDGVSDAAETLFGFLDFTHCDIFASQEEIEKALLNPLSQAVTVQQDGTNPWQPIDYVQPGVGLDTNPGLQTGIRAATSIAFSGHGTLSFEYQLTGGALSVAIDGREPEVIEVATSAWVACVLAFDAPGEHSVVFTYTAGGDGATAAIRNVRWMENEKFFLVEAALDEVRTDLREGPVRVPARMEHVLPFAYSSTNWIGDVQGTAAHVTITELTGTDADVTLWEPKGATRVLHDAPGEGAVKWHPKKGVWKATFDILGTSHREEVWFDLRNAITPGFMLMVF